MATLKQQMTADMPVFLNLDEFGEEWTMWPANVQADADTVTVVPVPDKLEGGRDMPGDGRALHKQSGTKIRNSVTLWMAKSITITEPEGTGSKADRWINSDNEVYSTVRVISHDFDFQAVLVAKSDYRSTRRGGQKS